MEMSTAIETPKVTALDPWAGQGAPMQYTPKTKPLDHQRKQFEEHGLEPAWALLWEQGTGKTKELLDEMGALISNGVVNAVIVIAPNGVHMNWLKDEIPKHVPEELRSRLHPHVYQTVKAETKWHQRAVDKCVKSEGIPMMLFSYEGFVTPKGKKAAWRLLQHKDVLFIADEAHHIKTPGAQKTKTILAASKYTNHKRISTGTPVAVGPFDLYSQLKFVKYDIWDQIGCSTFAAFKTFFGVWEKGYNKKQGREYDVLVSYKNLHILNEILNSISSRVLKSEVLDLPPKLYTNRYYEMTPKQRELYEALEEEFMIDWGDGRITNASLAIVRLLRFQQVLCGYIPFEDEMGNKGVEMIAGKNPRLDCLHEAVEDLPHQAIVWARFTKDIDLIADRLRGDGKKISRYDGTMSDDQLLKSKQAFNAGETDFFLGNQAMGSEGLTLNGAKSTFYYNNTFRFIHRLQSEDRNHRIGQDGAEHEVHVQEDPYAQWQDAPPEKVPSRQVGVLYTDLICQDSVDEHFIRNLLAKQDVASKITGDQLKAWIST